uniref:RING-type domain-containing protein n=1 Tax=Poecilia mexicana TaxID=48701 RepID=A0A3B3XN53_9TELE
MNGSKMFNKSTKHEENFSCSICLDLLKDPVTIPCGHSYCMDCIKDHWDGEDQRRIPSCPQCRKEFKPRPELEKNVMLAALVEDLKKTGLQDAPADHCYAGPEDVACDVCTGRKRKAVKTCLVCLISYCENHLQPHYESPAFKKHKLVNPTKTLMESICSCHDEVMKMLMDGYETVSAEAERAEKQKELQVSRQQIHQRIQDQEKDVKLLQQEVEAINRSADKAVEDSEKIFTELIHLLQKRSSEVKQQIRSQQETEVKEFGQNDKSWCLYCDLICNVFYHNNVVTQLPGSDFSRIGVYLDHRAGVLCFYNVSGSMTLIHRVQTRFTQPLYAGVTPLWFGDTAEFIKPK